MSSFVPPGYLSCMSVLEARYAEKFPDHELPERASWLKAVELENRHPVGSERNALAERIIVVVNQILEQLYLKQLTAVFITNYGESKIDPHRFARRGANRMLVSGEIDWSVKGTTGGRRPAIFLCEDLERGDIETEPNECSSAPKKGGRPSTGRDAALVYWGMFPNGHSAKDVPWKTVLHEVNLQLTRIGLNEVGMTALKDHVDKLKPTHRQ